uniref:Probable cobalamin biosynthesis protein CobD n=1 Tax=Archaeoglobus fulgidus TaxID=2234 RepID=A0A7J3M3Y3_ARCFL
MLEELYLLILAVLLDRIFKEPPLFAHPVVWFGKIIAFFQRIFEKLERSGVFLHFLLGFTLTALLVFFAIFLAKIPLPQPLQFLWHLYLLFSSISIWSMIGHAENCIKKSFDPAEVQKIVSRDTKKLSKPQLRSAVIESTAENFVDGVFAPLFYFSLFGIVGAVVYRAINTADAMIGYRGRYEYFGKVSAKLDDVLNFVPARLSLLFFEILRRGSFFYGLKNRVKLNGCTITAMSYVLGVKLEKPGYYSLPGRDPEDFDVVRAVKLFKAISLLSVAFSALIILLKSTIFPL